MADTEHDIAVLVAEDKRVREGDEAANVDECATCDYYLTPWKCNGGTEEYPCPAVTNTAGVTTNPLRTEGDWQHRDRIEALLADELADATECDRIGGEPTIVRPCPATDYCVFHHPDSLPCEDATCPAVIAAWARERTDT